MATPTATGGTQIAWVYGDHLGVPLLAMDASGNPLALSGFAVQGFPGQRRTLPDLYYNRYRDYDPSTGRYIQADPIGLAGGASPYSYAMNNPLRYTDPTGEFVPVVGVIIFGAVYGGLEGGLSDIGGQLLSGRSLNCIDWSSVGRSAGTGALIGGAFGGGGGLIVRFGTRLGFRFELGRWGTKGTMFNRSRRVPHFHLGTAPGLPNHHLPYQGLNWIKNAKALLDNDKLGTDAKDLIGLAVSVASTLVGGIAAWIRE